MIDLKNFKKFSFQQPLKPFIRFEKNRIVLSKKVYTSFKRNYIGLMVNEKEEKIILVGINHSEKSYTKKVGMYIGYGDDKFLNKYIGKKIQEGYYDEDDDAWLFDLKGQKND